MVLFEVDFSDLLVVQLTSFCCDGPEKKEDQQQSMQDYACVGG